MHGYVGLNSSRLSNVTNRPRNSGETLIVVFKLFHNSNDR